MSTEIDQPAADAVPEREQVQSPLTLVLPLASEEAAATVRGILSQPGGVTAAIEAALDELRTVHFARFVILDGEPPKLAVITSYDDDFRDYILSFTRRLGPLFDTILRFVSDPPTLPVADNAEEFVRYVEQHDLRSVGSFYSAYPLKRVGDIAPAPAPGA